MILFDSDKVTGILAVVTEDDDEIFLYDFVNPEAARTELAGNFELFCENEGYESSEFDEDELYEMEQDYDELLDLENLGEYVEKTKSWECIFIRREK